MMEEEEEAEEGEEKGLFEVAMEEKCCRFS